MSRPAKLVHVIAIIYTLITLLIMLEYLKSTGIEHQRELEMDWYLDYAFNLRQGNGYTACAESSYTYPCEEPAPVYAYFLPGYPVYLAGNLLIFETASFLPPMRLLQAVIAALITFLTVHLAGRYGTLSASVAGLLMAGNVSLYEYGALLLSETWFTFLLLVFVLLFTRVRNSAGFFAAGLLFGGILLTRGILMLTAPLLVFALPNRRLFWLVSGAILPLSAWIVRNFIVFGTLVPLSTGTGDVLLGANNSFVYSELNPGYWIYPADLPGGDQYLAMGELERDQAKRKAAWQFIRQQSPPVLAIAALFKVGAWAGMNEPSASKKIVLMTAMIIWLVVIWKARGSPAHRKQLRILWQQPEIRLIAVLLMGGLLNAVIFWADSRFRYPLEPYLAVLAGLGLSLLRSTTAPLLLLRFQGSKQV